MALTNPPVPSWPARLLRVVLGIMAGALAGWLLSGPAWRLLRPPYFRLTMSGADCVRCRFVDGPAGPFATHARIAIIVGLILASPIWLHQAFTVLAPRLRDSRWRWRYLYLAAAVSLFAAGAVLAYLTLRWGLWMTTPGDTVVLITVNDYLDEALARISISGILLEVPLFAWLWFRDRRGESPPDAPLTGGSGPG